MAKPPDPDEEVEETPAAPNTPNAKRKPSTTNNTPRKASATKTPNGPRTPNARRVSANANGKTPGSAPARAASRKAEPTLLGDFLLGRPSPQRQKTARRKSLEAVKMEMRADLVGRVRPPGKVKDRVKEWQKNIEKPGPLKQDNPDEIVVEAEEESECECDDDDRARRKDRDGKRPGRRKSPEEEKEKSRSKSASAPKKRVVSDSHWMKKPEKATVKERKITPPPKKGNRIPKDFLQATAVNPPIERKIEDWIGRTPVVKPRAQRIDAGQSETRQTSRWSNKEDSDENPRSRNASNYDDGIRVRPTEETPRSKRKSGQELDDGIRVTPSKSPTPDDGIRITPSPGDETPTRRSKNQPGDDGIRIKPSRDNSPDERSQNGSIRRPSDHQGLRTPKQRSQKHLRPPPSESRRASSYGTSQMETQIDEDDEEADKFSWMSPSPPENSKRRNRKSGSPATTDDIPFGNSAFSVLDLPVGAEAGTMRRPGPKRNNSFAKVPKVLKRVYTEGMKIVHDTPEPARAGPNQPPSIESWLNGTTDPFVERPTTAGSGLEAPENPSRRRSYKEDDRAERELTAERDTESEGRRNRRVRTPPETDQQDGSPSTPNNRDALPSVENSPTSPAGLKRTPATRNVTSPKSARKVPLKEAIFDAFKGESAMRSKAASPSPFDFIGLRERDLNRTPPDSPARDLDSIDEDTPTQSPRQVSVSSRTRFEEPVKEPEKPLPPFPRRQPPTTGVHRLSTIASVDTFNTSSSATESMTETESTADTRSEVSQTTVTQDTVFTGPTSSSLSRKSTKTGLKRRLTKHSDLLSVLSLPDTPPQVERSKSVRSARSIRTTRRHLESASVQDLMQELAEDETKYMRELNTLVDGVIPVLLTSVLSKSDSAVAAGLLDPDSATNSSFTKPIVDMGVALERLRSIHKRIPLDDSDTFFRWLQSAQKVYEEYLLAWRAGFEGVVVNLAPSHPHDTSNKMPRNKNGDVINDNGEVVDVAYLLKRPLVRVKYLSRVIKGLCMAKKSDLLSDMSEQMQKLEDLARRRAKEEAARREDRRAYTTDSTRVRCLRTLVQIDGIKIDRNLQVAAKDTFSLELPHSSGQNIECQVDMFLRDNPENRKDADILIVEVGVDGRFLLFPSLDKNHVSARMGDNDHQLVVQFRGVTNVGTRVETWNESFILETEDPEAAQDWLDMLGTVPVPPPIVRKELLLDSKLASEISSVNTLNQTEDIPIGERRRTEDKLLVKKRQRVEKKRPTTLFECLEEYPYHSELGEMCILDVKGLNQARELAGLLPLTLQQKRPTPARYASAKIPVVMSGAIGIEDDKEVSVGSKQGDDRAVEDSPASSPLASEKSSTPLRDSMRPDPETLKRQASPPIRHDGAPIPPAHRSPSPSTPNPLKMTPILDSPTPKARTRRTSSPLKHEWQPDNASLTSPSERSDSDSDSDTYSSSSEDELEAVDSPIHDTPAVVYRKVTPPVSLYNLPNGTVAPSNSASQAPYRGAPVSRTEGNTRKTIARLSYWKEDGIRSCWTDLWPEICSIVITPGRIEAYEISAAHSSPIRTGELASSGSSDLNSETDAGADRPLVALDLTPLVTLRQSNAVDIEVKSPTLSQSRLKCRGNVRFRTLTAQDGVFLYRAVHYARMNNPVFIKLEEERRYANFGSNAYQQAIAANTKRSFFGRQRSYRASARAPQSDVVSDQSGKSSVATALKRLSGGGLFNIARSSIDRSGPMSHSTSSSDYSGATPPGTPGSPSQAGSSAYSQMQDLGWEDIPITFSRLVTHSKWDVLGPAFLTVSTPPPTMRPESSQNYGILKRITVTRKKLHMGSPQGPNPEALVICDIAVGVGCFNLVARKGVVMHDWRDIRGNDGQVGVIGATGGVSATMGKWLLQTDKGMARDWIWSLTGGLYDRSRGSIPSGYGM
ncbi:hypothetical protein L207DRAFT_433790 [Hyaloscypha variabilis F]|uniref:Uncharacterized protein n=1 Tax=Hyaloscypha variabilis (strain UAMH 11265 / GT02V1 / F) TaxID=1149755 RepID=A0A2J6REZ2_HYAVF|nr:hypothetical protein L207DRAFT_433790 [Hyaloscypha variabilis F]